MQLMDAERRLLERHVLHVDGAHDPDMLLALPPLEHPERWLALMEQLPCVS